MRLTDSSRVSARHQWHTAGKAGVHLQHAASARIVRQSNVSIDIFVLHASLAVFARVPARAKWFTHAHAAHGQFAKIFAQPSETLQTPVHIATMIGPVSARAA